MTALILGEKAVNSWKLKAGASKQLINKGVDSRSHYQRLKRWLRQEKVTPGVWIQIAKASTWFARKQGYSPDSYHCAIV